MGKLPPLSLIESAVLRTKEGTEIVAKELWKLQPVFFFALRRPGCVLCRDTAQQVWEQHEALEAAGLRVVCLVHEWIEREITAFHPAYWGGELYHDADKTFYKALGQGSLRTQSVLSMLNPLNAAWGRIRAANKRVKESNTTGEGTILGGLLVVGKGDSGIKAMHVEKSFGDYGEIAAVLEEAKKLAAQ